MTKIQRRTFLFLEVLSLIVLALYIVPNLQGAANVEMLSVFQPDEYAQYPYLIHMLSNSGQSIIQTIHTFLVYGHYYYGYPFYFFSGLALIPLKLILGAKWAASTAVIIMVLRETINVLPMLISVLLLIWMQTRFRSTWKSLLLFVFLESLSAVVANNEWWHPDSLLVLFCVLTLFFLQRDNLRFGVNFYLSAVACGLSITSKTLGVLFFTTYFVYLVYGVISKKLPWQKTFGKAALFLLVMAATILVSMPQLLMPMERAEIIAVFKGNLAENSKGFWISGGGLAQNWSTFTGYISMYYSGWWIFVPALGFLIAGIINQKTRLLSLLIATWLATYCGYFLFIAVTLRPHYFLPVFLPLFTCLALFWPENSEHDVQKITQFKIKETTPLFWVNGLSIVILAGAGIFNGIATGNSILQINHEETTSPSIQFFTRVNEAYLEKLPTDKNFTFYRDWRAYVAPQNNWNVVMNWDLADYSKMDELKPAVIFLETENILYFSDATKLNIALDETGMQLKYYFYTDAKNDAVKGYVLLAENNFGKAFARQDIYDTYFK
jgi:hypothetical protein